MKTRPANGKRLARRAGPGRPRNDAADRAILDAAVALLLEGGIEGTTVSAVVARSGVARATVYRRWPTRDALLQAALSEVKGRPPAPLSGDLERDLARAIEQARVIFDAPSFQAYLPLLVRELLRDRSESGVTATWDRVARSVRPMAEEYERLAESAGLRPEVDAHVVLDVIVGSMLAHLLSTGSSASPDTAAVVLDVLLNGLRRREGGSPA